MPLATLPIQAQHGHGQDCPRAKEPRAVRKSSFWCAAFTESSVYREPFLAQKQIRPVTLGLL
jgi:hypothetical protein